MAHSAAKTIAGELLDELNAIANNPRRTDLDVLRVLRAAASLKNSHAADYFMIEGICESLRERPASVKTAFEKAISLGGWDSCLAENYAIGLHEAGDIPGAWGVIERGLRSFDSDPGYLADTFSTLLNTGNLVLAADVEQRLIKMGSVKTGSGPTWLEFLELIAKDGHSAGLMGNVISMAVTSVKKASARPTMYYTFTRGLGNRPHMSMGIAVDGPVSMVHPLEVAVLSSIYDYVESIEADREAGSPSILDWISVHLRSEQKDAGRLHAA